MKLLIVAILNLLAAAVAVGQYSIAQFGIRWTFDCELSTVAEPGKYHYGQFANGDYWVVGPASIVEITPQTRQVQPGWIANGSMINPQPGNLQGYDSTLVEWHSNSATGYDHKLNVAFGVSPQTPLVVPAGSSLVSSISQATRNNRPQLKTAAVLTVLAEAPPQGSFRPAYCGNDKSVRHNIADLDYSMFQSLTPVKGTPSLTLAQRWFERPWLDHKAGWTGRNLHPSDNMPDYGADMFNTLNAGALMLNLNHTNQRKELLLIRYVQVGIDLYGIVAAGGHKNWTPDGGHAGGRKLPILIAGHVLGDTDMKNIGTKSGSYLYSRNRTGGSYGPGNPPPDYIFFGEDSQTFYVSELNVNVTSGNHHIPWTPGLQPLTWEGWRKNGGTHDFGEPYCLADIGLPEYGIRHATTPGGSARKWDVHKDYRTLASCGLPGAALAARMMGLKEAWNHDALFDYADRYAQTADRSTAYYWPEFSRNMWDRYRRQYGPLWRESHRSESRTDPEIHPEKTPAYKLRQQPDQQRNTDDPHDLR